MYVEIKNRRNKILLNKNYQSFLWINERMSYALRYVKVQTDEICLAAIGNFSYALYYVKNQTDKICLTSVKEYGWTLKFVKNQTKEICEAAVETSPCARFFIKGNF
jgi:hypothetical protein